MDDHLCRALSFRTLTLIWIYRSENKSNTFWALSRQSNHKMDYDKQGHSIQYFCCWSVHAIILFWGVFFIQNKLWRPTNITFADFRRSSSVIDLQAMHYFKWLVLMFFFFCVFILRFNLSSQLLLNWISLSLNYMHITHLLSYGTLFSIMYIFFCVFFFFVFFWYFFRYHKGKTLFHILKNCIIINLMHYIENSFSKWCKKCVKVHMNDFF